MAEGLMTQRCGGRSAVFDTDGRYRYRLSRRWSDGPRVVFIMLNPSTATAQVDDPTTRRVWRFAREFWHAGRVDVVNLYALRATDPKALLHDDDPVGPANDEVLRRIVRGSVVVVAAWGNRGGRRAEEVAGLLARRTVPTVALSITRGGHPGHPLYLPSTALPVPWPA